MFIKSLAISKINRSKIRVRVIGVTVRNRIKNLLTLGGKGWERGLLLVTKCIYNFDDSIKTFLSSSLRLDCKGL